MCGLLRLNELVPLRLLLGNALCLQSAVEAVNHKIYSRTLSIISTQLQDYVGLSSYLISIVQIAEAVAVVGSIALLIDLDSKVASLLSEFALKMSDVPESFRLLSTQSPC